MSAREERLVTPETIAAVDQWLDDADVFAKGYWQYVDGKLTTVGLRIGQDWNKVVAFFGDTIVRHEDGSHTVLSAKDAAELDKLRVQVAEVRGQRDAWHDWADTLAYKVAPVEVLGRHGDEGKFPWDDALKLITPAAEVQRLREERHSTNEALDDAVREAAALRARVAELEAAITHDNPCRPCGCLKRFERHAWGCPTLPADDVPVLPQQRQVEDPHDGPLHHDYALGRDLPAIPHQQDRRAL